MAGVAAAPRRRVALHRYFAGGLSPFEYETLFELVTRLNESTGSHYRVAYANSTRTSLGLHQLFAGQAVIYNADRLRNTTSETLGQSETLVPWSDEAIVGAHMRQSHECMETRPEQLSLCSLIDPDGYLTSPFTNASGRWDLVATASAFMLRDDPQSRILVHNVHINFNDFADFDIAGYVESDVIGAIIGKPATYSPLFSPAISSQALPTEEKTGSLCAPPDVLWSDHCALLLTVQPGNQ